MKNAYSFHPETGVFIGCDFAQESPLEPGIFLLPAGATFVEPPEAEDGNQAVWNGEEWNIEPIPVPEPEPQPQPEPQPEPQPITWDIVRAQRNALLERSDWTQLADSPLTAEQKDAWASYRQELRAVPQTFETPVAVVWPPQPTE